MKLSDHQAVFTIDIARLVLWVDGSVPGYRVRFREVYRPQEMQQLYVDTGRSWTTNSQHSKSLAADLVLDIDGVYQRDTEAYTPLGVKWESLSSHNRWGGRFSDGNHFERRIEPRHEPSLTWDITA